MMERRLAANQYIYPDPLTRYDSRPSMKDLSKHVIPLVATRWYDLGLSRVTGDQTRERIRNN